MDYSIKISELGAKIREYRTAGKDAAPLIKQQIGLFLKARDEMLLEIQKRGIEYNLKIAEAEIAQLSAIIALSEEIGGPVDKYEERIAEIQGKFIGNNVTIEFSE